jgi:signal peptidase II
MKLPLDNLRSPAAMARFLLIAIVGLGMDLWTKAWAFRSLVPTDGILRDGDGRVRVITDTFKIIPGWLEFRAVANQGAVFGLGQGRGSFFVLVSIGAIFFLGYLFLQSHRQRLYQIILGMLLAGVIGNMYDRMTYGYVRDMIHVFPRWEWLFPYVFNVADSLLCVGVGMMVVHSILHWKHPA